MTVKLDTLKLDQLIATDDEEAGRIVRKFAFLVEGTASQLAPVDTSALKNSIQAEEHSGPLRWWVHDGVEYGLFQEIGFTHWISGQFIQNPFMVPAVEQHRPAWDDAWRRHLRR